jgi:protein-tyrosine-phosphatase
MTNSINPLNKPKLLFICRHNTVRSQVAQVLANKISHGQVDVTSAGIELSPIPKHIQTWAKTLTPDAPALVSTLMADLEHQQFDMVITLCDKSHQALPELPTDTNHIRWNFSHPDDEDSLRHLEMELADRIRLLFLAKGVLS